MTSMWAETFWSILNLKESFLWAATRKNETKLRKTKEKENNTDESEIPNSLKLFPFEPKTNIGDITVVEVMMGKKGLNIK